MRTTVSAVDYGSLSIPLSAQRQVDAAFAYLARDPAARAVIEHVESSADPHRIEIDHRGDDSYHPDTGTIRWDPHSAMRLAHGGSQSPALGLAHELDHATAGLRGFLVLHSVPDAQYDDLEERRVITGMERHAARTLHEGIRTDHAGSLYRVHDPTDR